jgi:hypothetical protein
VAGTASPQAATTRAAGRSYLDPETVVSIARYGGRRIASHARFAETFEVPRSIDHIGGPLP